MIALWLCGILAALILLLCLTRVGVHVVLANGSTTVDLRISWFHIRVFPAKKKAEKATKQAKKKPEETEKKPKKSLPKIALTDIKDGVRTLWPPLKRALDRTRRGIRIRPLNLRVTLGAEDPDATAGLYGYLHAGVWTAMPVLEKALDIPNPYIHIGIDFDASKTGVNGEIGVIARIGTLLRVALGVAFPALRWFLRYQKKVKQQTVPVSQPAA